MGQQQAAESEFTLLWAEDKIPGWSDAVKAKTNGNSQEAGIWCSACELAICFLSPCQLKGLEGQKHYSKQTVYDAHLTSKKHVKAAARQTSEATSNANGKENGADDQAQQQRNGKESRIQTAALMTYLTTKLLSTMLSTVAETKSNVERRFSLTAKEREAELAEKPAAAPVVAPNADENIQEEEEEEERIYNPLKLPLGWDGKPIPYWLYKLHGLGVEYRCEICSDHVYMGR